MNLLLTLLVSLENEMTGSGTVVFYTDRSIVKEREHIISENEERLQIIVDSLSEGIATLDAKGHIKTFNIVLPQMFQQSADSLVGRPFDELVRWPEEVCRATVEGCLADMTPQNPTKHLELTGLRPSGQFHVGLMLKRVLFRNETIFIAALNDLTEQKHAQSTIIHQATHDTLTGLPNRAHYYDRLTQAVEHAQRTGGRLAVVFLDLDHFKSINDTFGHGVGDDLLIGVAKRLKTSVRSTDTVARIAGDEFVLILTNLCHDSDVILIASKLLDALCEPFSIGGHQFSISASLGIALFPTDGTDQELLLNHADNALYQAKARGRKRFELFEPSMASQSSERAALGVDLRVAIANDELSLVYQPQFCLIEGNLVGFEALIRWQHPTRGNVQPDRFLPLAEEIGLIGDIGSWVLRRACEDLANWHSRGCCIQRLAIKVSPRQLQDDFETDFEETIHACGLEAHYLELELTETTLLLQQEMAFGTLQRVLGLGVGLALDGFGARYSSLSNLHKYPVQRIKIEQSSVRELTENLADAALVSAVITLAKSLNIKVIADGVETEEQLDMLRQLGCDEGQGVLLGPPCNALSVSMNNANISLKTMN
jgi:diguanylate cyclase (GGDEF)-like protein/PAS domain S-box-containing protein